MLFSTTVLEVYRITLLSNTAKLADDINQVLEVYRITLLSNQEAGTFTYLPSFRGLQNYTTLKHQR